MCSTCNYKTYEKVTIQSGDKSEEKLQQSLGMGSLMIRCDTNGTNYCLLVKDEPKSEFRLYSCPTCGKKLWP